MLSLSLAVAVKAMFLASSERNMLLSGEVKLLPMGGRRRRNEA
jgi:hypothetical protein